MRLLHYIADTMFARNHLSFIGINREFPEIKQIFLMSPDCRTEKNLSPYWDKLKLDEIEIAKGNLKQKQDHVVKQILKINPDAILFSYIEPPLEPLLVTIRKRQERIKFYYMHHGIYCPGLIQKFGIKKYARGKHQVFRHFDQLFFTPREINSYFKSFISPAKLTELRGYVGLDLQMGDQVGQSKLRIQLSFPNIEVKGYLLLIGGKFPDEYLQILKEAVEFAKKHSWVVLAKMKPNRGVWDLTAKNKLHRHSRVKVLLDYEVIYDYLSWMDLVVVQRYSTVYYEALALRIPVVLCQLKELSIKFQGITGFKDLPQAYSTEKLRSSLERVVSGKVNWDSDRRKYLVQQFGQVELENVTQKILRTILRIILSQNKSS